MNGLDLFSGIGGISSALAPWVTTVAYCENDRYAQSVLLSRQANGDLPLAPIWDDVRTLQGCMLPEVDMLFGGFPCQDIRVAGNGAGLEGKRSGLVFEVFRLVSELAPKFVFLENVPAIRTRGGERVVKELATLGYDCRWDCLSAFDVGAPHKRDRWFLLAHRDGDGRQVQPQPHGQQPQSGRAFWNDIDRLCDALSNSRSFFVRDKQRRRSGESRPGQAGPRDDGEERPVADAQGVGRREGRPESAGQQRRPDAPVSRWWQTEPDVGRVVDGLPARVDRLRGLGNAVVPAQAREAFRRLMGIKIGTL